ncbi:hypothetical protein RvY_17438-2 [Ramazzottius varieornatus]|uniref:Uncharacterized protein n=1 Tax=Ramazzottius varieornatus TaxID=947166 RepID=A0A1D1W4C0_RAMVA|nr:hypothetical protein RvY_17438-2 [Ramazzottius varieornatus]
MCHHFLRCDPDLGGNAFDAADEPGFPDVRQIPGVESRRLDRHHCRRCCPNHLWHFTAQERNSNTAQQLETQIAGPSYSCQSALNSVIHRHVTWADMVCEITHDDSVR